ncbi:hypothetical protein SFA35_12555 [Pseudomonas sp. HR96]|uniref:hypothetical protein n=1 Tax=Pseudomonas sp. HR96 TaxID=1027966 RepID=UPI002A7531AB|nr:hypothetical protein [Pseudomonas sp. HR96]WPO97508.1 hypothetical protein SFA35_12555 [Pseudomonas sp. HR96]
MTSQGTLRSPGDFANKRTVEYATILVDLPHKPLPANLRNPGYEDDDLVAGLYVSPAGRLTYSTLYLDDLTLAHQYAAYVDQVFSERRYAGLYALRVEIAATTMTVTATKMRALLSHSQKSAEHCD